jgi:hypothetical protein
VQEQMFGVPMLVSYYVPDDTVLLIGRKKRPYHYSPIPLHIQDELMNMSFDYTDRLMGVLYLKDSTKDSFIMQDMELQEIRGRIEALDYLAKLIEERSK